jgi:membrane-bound lytic murein transglycosylase B
VVAKDRNQSEFRREIWDYLDSAVSPKRVENGQAALRRHDRTLERIEARYGVEKEIVAAVWGMESSYGTRLGNLPLVQSLATLAYDGRRGAFFEKQLIAALQIVQSGDVSPENMKGSWAGAMGHTQFIPTSYLAYAVDFTGDGRRDVWSDDPTDALASTAAYLERFGWRKGMPWGVEVQVPRGASFGDARRMPSEWAARGVVGTDGRAVRDHGAARILQPAGPAGASFMVFANFDVIKRYNNADAYALGVGHLADRIAGGPPIQASWPRGYDPLSFEERMEMQRRLKRKGFAVEKIDGIVGPNTVAAIRAFQRSVGAEEDGLPSQQLLALLRRS